jgi:hypothetical protein
VSLKPDGPLEALGCVVAALFWLIVGGLLVITVVAAFWAFVTAGRETF